MSHFQSLQKSLHLLHLLDTRHDHFLGISRILPFYAVVMAAFFLIVIAMKRNYYINDLNPQNFKKLATQVAFHEAGHAVAIYLYNKQQQLPSIFFQIHLNSYDDVTLLTTDDSQTAYVAASIEGGCLIENLALNLSVGSSEIYPEEKEEYHRALNADVINLLAGSIAEQHYLILRDNEVIDVDLISIKNLGRYGNYSDMQKINNYLRFFSDDPREQQEKLTELLKKSFLFITDRQTWKSVTAVAYYLLNSQEKDVHCEDIFNVIDRVTV
ncbi:MAG: hypothetical protein Q9M50_04300 [Methylococcales bacterium]|nr:hypothetical protein [Methylococcales bacterium]